MISAKSSESTWKPEDKINPAQLSKIIYSTVTSILNPALNLFTFSRSLTGVQLKPVGASHLLPLFDDVSLKAVFSVSVARPRDARVLSNMPLRTSQNT